MCLAIPPNSGRQYALPLGNFPDASTSSASAAAMAACGHGHQSCGDASCPNSFVGLCSSGLQLPDLPPTAPEVVGSFDCTLGPTSLSPYASSDIATAAAAETAQSKPTTKPRSAAAKQRRKRGPQRPGKTATDKERLFVQHDYHDLAGEPDDVIDPKNLNGGVANVPVGCSAPAGNSLLNESFPMKLHRILEENEGAGLGHIIGWQPHGRAFKIRNPALFTERIMRNYFPKMRKLTSLQRQFNLYGFERLTRDGPDAGAYYHEAFLRHRPGLSVQRMFRIRVKGTGYKAASNPEAEPDLYSYKGMEDVADERRVHETNFGPEVPPALVAPGSGGRAVKYYTGFPACTFDAKQGNDSEAAEVTESPRSSFCSSSEDSNSNILQDMNVLRNPMPMAQMAPSVPSHMFVPVQAPVQQAQPPCFSVNDATNILQAANDGNILQAAFSSMSNQIQHRRLSGDADMDRFLSLPSETQDSFLQDFFSANDVTPMSAAPTPVRHNYSGNGGFAASAPAAAMATTVSAPQPQFREDPSLLMEFADLWENASSFQPNY